jgi:hypothetical protein
MYAIRLDHPPVLLLSSPSFDVDGESGIIAGVA